MIKTLNKITLTLGRAQATGDVYQFGSLLDITNEALERSEKKLWVTISEIEINYLKGILINMEAFKGFAMEEFDNIKKIVSGHKKAKEILEENDPLKINTYLLNEAQRIYQTRQQALADGRDIVIQNLNSFRNSRATLAHKIERMYGEIPIILKDQGQNTISLIGIPFYIAEIEDPSLNEFDYKIIPILQYTKDLYNVELSDKYRSINNLISDGGIPSNLFETMDGVDILSEIADLSQKAVKSTNNKIFKKLIKKFYSGKQSWNPVDVELE